MLPAGLNVTYTLVLLNCICLLFEPGEGSRAQRVVWVLDLSCAVYFSVELLLKLAVLGVWSRDRPLTARQLLRALRPRGDTEESRMRLEPRAEPQVEAEHLLRDLRESGVISYDCKNIRIQLGRQKGRGNGMLSSMLLKMAVVQANTLDPLERGTKHEGNSAEKVRLWQRKRRQAARLLRHQLTLLQDHSPLARYDLEVVVDLLLPMALRADAGPPGYLRNGWNVVDLVVVIVSWPVVSEVAADIRGVV